VSNVVQLDVAAFERAIAGYVDNPERFNLGTILRVAREHADQYKLPADQAAAIAERIFAERRPASDAFAVDFADIDTVYRVPDPICTQGVQRGRVHALTAPTNHAKTAALITLALAVGNKANRDFGIPDVEHGNVLMLCGENPEDSSGRLIATAHELDVDRKATRGRIRIVPHAFPLNARLDDVRAEAALLGELALCIVDTNASFYGYESEDDNIMARQQAADLRELTRLAGTPAVLASCHPVKHASRENLMPRGGSGFLNEIDTNLIVWKDGDVATLHWQHKIRGPSFDPLKFSLEICPIPGFQDRKGRVPHTVVALPVSDDQADALERQAVNDENRLLFEMVRTPNESIAAWAKFLGWVTPAGEPHKSKVHRLLMSLQAAKLVEKKRGRWALTTEGKRASNG
jgi:hypothetical protein